MAEIALGEGCVGVGVLSHPVMIGAVGVPLKHRWVDR
jgi:hypothetical protein